MRGNIVVAAAIFGVALVLACVILVIGVGRSIDRAGAQVAESIVRHGVQTYQAGEQVGQQLGPPLQAGLEGLNVNVKEHAQAMHSAGQAIQSAGKSIESAGQTVATPTVTIRGAVPITAQQPVPISAPQPLPVRGVGEGGSLPVDVELGQD